jgi:DNA replication protein DnaC
MKGIFLGKKVYILRLCPAALAALHVKVLYEEILPSETERAGSAFLYGKYGRGSTALLFAMFHSPT